jgi:hypothetical protein
MNTTLESEPSVGERSVKSTVKTKTTPKPWQRQRGEPVESFRLFLVYVELGDERSLRRLSELDGSPCLRVIERKSRRWNWRARVEALDARLARQAARSILRRLYRERLVLMVSQIRIRRAALRYSLKVVKTIDPSVNYRDLRLMNRSLDSMKRALIVSSLAASDLESFRRALEETARGRSPNL